eukprot:Tamp_27813.p3 GENE.Tamp_27813~~Tamp_27813.p3  ORF type:complete len:107 (-),score=19.32 Tamp_27813:144-464(-)
MRTHLHAPPESCAHTQLAEMKKFLLDAGVPDFNLPFRPDFNIPFKVDDEAARGMEKDDVDHDGKISMEEYVAAVSNAVKVLHRTPKILNLKPQTLNPKPSETSTAL